MPVAERPWARLLRWLNHASLAHFLWTAATSLFAAGSALVADLHAGWVLVLASAPLAALAGFIQWRQRIEGRGQVLQHRPAEPRRARPTREVVTPHPWIDDDGQLVLTVKMSDSSPDNPTSGSIGGCVVSHNGREWEAQRVPQYPATWMQRAYFPRNFPGAPPIEEGEYEVRWLTPLFDLRRLEASSWRLDRTVAIRVTRDANGKLSVDLGP